MELLTAARPRTAELACARKSDSEALKTGLPVLELTVETGVEVLTSAATALLICLEVGVASGLALLTEFAGVADGGPALPMECYPLFACTSW